MIDINALIIQYREKLFSIAMTLTKDKMRAEDVLHDTIIKILRFKDKFDGRNFKAWSTKVLIRVFLQDCTKQQRQKRKHDRYEIYGYLSRAENTYKEIISEDMIRALNALPREQMLVAMLTDVYGYNHKETGEILNCPEGTVMSRLFRAHGKLRKVLETKETSHESS